MSHQKSPAECGQLEQFRNFLKSATNATNGSNTETAVVVTRNNDSYELTHSELKAEIKCHLFGMLESKNVPLAFYKSIYTKVEEECCNNKELKSNAATEENEQKYDLNKLHKFIMNQLNRIFNKLADNAEATNLRNYAEKGTICELDKECICNTQDLQVYHLEGHIKNKPRKMEDRNVCWDFYSKLYDLKNQKYRFYGVFDGHSGALAASYTASQLPQILADQLSIQTAATNFSIADFYRESLEAAFLLTDQRFASKNLNSGTTAVTALISLDALDKPKHLFVAWVGDSKALLVSPCNCLQLVKAHKPDSPEERQRIEQAGGSVLHIQGQFRVNGILNVARSIGDCSVSAVIAEPDFVDVPLNDGHDFLVLGTDGLWDHVSELNISEIIYQVMADMEQSLDNIPKLLIEKAKQGDSQDNITVVIVLLKQRSEIVKHHQLKVES